MYRAVQLEFWLNWRKAKQSNGGSIGPPPVTTPTQRATRPADEKRRMVSSPCTVRSSFPIFAVPRRAGRPFVFAL